MKDVDPHEVTLEHALKLVAEKKEFHKLALAGYALALEASLETAFDYGVLVYVSNNGDVRVDWEPVYISTSLRKEFIEARDELIDMLINDIEPPKASSCPSSCPFKEVCG